MCIQSDIIQCHALYNFSNKLYWVQFCTLQEARQFRVLLLTVPLFDKIYFKSSQKSIWFKTTFLPDFPHGDVSFLGKSSSKTIKIHPRWQTRMESQFKIDTHFMYKYLSTSYRMLAQGKSQFIANCHHFLHLHFANWDANDTSDDIFTITSVRKHLKWILIKYCII